MLSESGVLSEHRPEKSLLTDHCTDVKGTTDISGITGDMNCSVSPQVKYGTWLPAYSHTVREHKTIIGKKNRNDSTLRG